MRTKLLYYKVFHTKPVNLGLSILDLSETVMYEFWYERIKTKILWKCKTLFMDTSSFIVYVKTDDVYKDMVKDAEKRFGSSKFETDRPLP